MMHETGQLGHAHRQAGAGEKQQPQGQDVEAARGGVQEASGHPHLELKRQVASGF